MSESVSQIYVVDDDLLVRESGFSPRTKFASPN